MEADLLNFDFDVDNLERFEEALLKIGKSLEKEKESQNHRIQVLEMSTSSSSTEIQDKLVEYKAEIDRLKRELADKEAALSISGDSSQIVVLNSELERSSRQIDVLKLDLEKARGDNKKLSTQLAEEKARNSTLSSSLAKQNGLSQAERDSLASQLEDERRKASKLSEMHHEQAKTGKDIQQRFVELMEKNAELDQALTTARRQLVTAVEDKADVTRKLKLLEDASGSKDSSTEFQMDEMESQVEELRKENAQLTAMLQMSRSLPKTSSHGALKTRGSFHTLRSASSAHSLKPTMSAHSLKQTLSAHSLKTSSSFHGSPADAAPASYKSPVVSPTNAKSPKSSADRRKGLAMSPKSSRKAVEPPITPATPEESDVASVGERQKKVRCICGKVFSSKVLLKKHQARCGWAKKLNTTPKQRTMFG